MRFLTIVRHAEAAPAGPDGDDFHRSLTERGREQCAQLRTWASDATALGAYGPCTALVSAATRTRQTFLASFDETPFVQSHETSSLIYNGRRDVTAEDVLIDLQAIDPVTTSLLVVAHNPTVTELLFVLAGELPSSARDGSPVASAYVLAIETDQSVGLARYRLVNEFIPA